MDESYYSFGQWLKHRRQSHDLTQVELAERVGVALVSLRKIEAGERRPSKQVALRLSEALAIPPAERLSFVEFARAQYTDGLAAFASVRADPPLFGAVADGLTSHAGARRHNLPLSLTSFIGRKIQIAEILSLLETAHMVTLTGPGGCGKTRLAVEVARSLADRSAVFPDGIWLVDLAPLRDGRLLGQAIASTVGLGSGSRRPLTDQVVDFFAEREVLLVLDNCEHIVEDCALMSDRLLRGSRSLRMLATSRDPLGIGGEVIYGVPPLQTPDPERLPALEEAAAFEAIRLFDERSRNTQPDFRISRDNITAVAEIAYRLDGIPLAIELAAARIRLLSPDQIVARLGDRFNLLTSGSRAALPRQQTLRASLDWSYELLNRSEAALLNRLAVFTGSFTLAAVEAICAGSSEDGLGFTVHPAQVLSLLAGLIDHSLVGVRAGELENRCRLLETVRQYGLEKLEALGELRVMQDRHLAYYLGLAEQGDEGIWAGQLDWVERFEREYENFRGALALAFERHPESAVRLAIALSQFTIYSSRLYESYTWSKRLLALTANWPAGPLRATVLWYAGDKADWMYEKSLAEELFLAATTIAREASSPRPLSLSLGGLLDLYRRANKWEAIEPHVGELLEASREARAVDLAYTLWILGEWAMAKRDFESARAYLAETLLMTERENMPLFQGHAYQSIGRLAQIEGDYALAWTSLLGSARIWRTARYLRGLHATVASLGRLALRHGDWQQARKLFEEYVSIQRELKPKEPWHKHALAGFGGVAGLAGHDIPAARLFGAAERAHDGVPPHVEQQLAHDIYRPIITALRSRLGDVGFERAWSEGNKMPLEEALEYALNEVNLDGTTASR